MAELTDLQSDKCHGATARGFQGAAPRVRRPGRADKVSSRGRGVGKGDVTTGHGPRKKGLTIRLSTF